MNNFSASVAVRALLADREFDLAATDLGLRSNPFDALMLIVCSSFALPPCMVNSGAAIGIGKRCVTNRDASFQRCSARAQDPNRYDWVFKSLEAELFDHAGKPIIRHFAAPTWEATDGSSVVGEAPAGGCSAELSGSQARTRYTADYLFYRVR